LAKFAFPLLRIERRRKSRSADQLTTGALAPERSRITGGRISSRKQATLNDGDSWTGAEGRESE